MILYTPVICESEVSITVLWLLCTPRYTAVWIKDCLKSMSIIKVATMKNTDGAAHSSSYLKLKYLLPFTVSYVCSTRYTAVRIKSYLKSISIIKVATLKKYGPRYGQFPHKGSHHVQPPNQCFLLSAKMNGTQRRTLVSPFRMHWTKCSMLKGTSWAKVTLNSEKIKPVALAVIELLVWRHQAGS